MLVDLFVGWLERKIGQSVGWLVDCPVECSFFLSVSRFVSQSVMIHLERQRSYTSMFLSKQFLFSYDQNPCNPIENTLCATLC